MSASATFDRGILIGDTTRDYNHATDTEYAKLRKQADVAYQKRLKLLAELQQAYKRGDKARAKELSDQAKQQLAVAEDYNAQAAEYVFRENNADLAANEIDLHGLYVKEAVWVLRKRIGEAQARNQLQLRVIVGKGLHLANHVAKIKPAADEVCQELGLRHYIDKKNTGVMVVELQGGTGVQPGAAQQPHYQQQGSGGNNNNNNDQMVNLVVKILCGLFKACK